MNKYFSVTDLPKNKNYGLTIGNFDGVHKGHQFLLEAVKEKCLEKSWEPLVLTFNPHPMTVLLGKKNFLICDYTEKNERLFDIGIENILELNFNRELSQLLPGEFLDNFILNSSSIKGLFLGHDFSFGANKSGNHDYVLEHCKGTSVIVETLPRFVEKDSIYSSTKVREALEKGDAERALFVLGRPFEINGIVEKGEGRGKTLGFATANTRIAREKLLPGNGVYYSTTIVKNCEYKSITNIGSNPTFNGFDDRKLIETHILSYNENLYGEKIKTLIHKKVRDEIRFSSKEMLIEQIQKDVALRDSYDV